MRRRIIATVIAGAAGLSLGLLPAASASAAVTGGGGGGGGGGGWCDSRYDDCCDRDWNNRWCAQGVGGWYDPNWRDNYYNSNYYDSNWRGYDRYDSDWRGYDSGRYYDGDRYGGYNDGWDGYRYND
ncbi:hypothetical protein ABZZ17_37035 [Streptomyces sp. NPDC006512]|uniref:hypothetical protein n=1 Tax=Streptomyces sp. NPDC006512 TaxID=3154307 RepID=UPI0033AED3C5